MKVLQIITKSNWGGAQKHVFELSLGLVSNGFSVEVACGQNTTNAPLVDKLNRAEIPVHKIKSLGRDISLVKDIFSFFEIISIIKKAKPDIVHLHSSKIGGIGALASRFCGVRKIIFTAHGTPFKENRFLLSNYAIRFVSYLTVLLADEVICVSQRVYLDYPKIFFSTKLTVIHNGISAPLYLDKSESREKLHIKSDGFTQIIGTIAELHSNKGLLYLLKAANSLKQRKVLFTLHILGGGEQKQKLINFIEKNNLQDVVFIHGFIAGASQYTKAFDVFVLPSINEGLPYVLLEAGLANVSVVATDVGGIPEVIAHNQTGLLVKPRDALCLANSLEKILSDAPLRSSLVAALYKKVTEEYSLEEMVSSTLEVYIK